MVDMSIDFDSFFRNRIESLLIRASWVKAVRSMLGLEGASQVWSDRAAWYLWLLGASGVYNLAFSEGEVVSSNDHPFYEGRFALKCYPYPNHPSFAGFSPEERWLIKSDRFDATHTPRFEAAAEIPDSLFIVGSISLLFDVEETLSLLTYQSLDFLRINQSNGVSDVSGANLTPGAERLVRNVAGWTIGYPLFDCLVGLYAYFTRQPPVFFGATRCQGFEYSVLADCSAVCQPSQRTTQTGLTIGFNPFNGDADRIEGLWKSRLEADEKIQTAWKLPASIHDAVRLDLPDNLTLNPLWWEIAGSDFKSEQTSICGCAESHCHHT